MDNIKLIKYKTLNYVSLIPLTGINIAIITLLCALNEAKITGHKVTAFFKIGIISVPLYISIVYLDKFVLSPYMPKYINNNVFCGVLSYGICLAISIIGCLLVVAIHKHTMQSKTNAESYKQFIGK